MITKTFEIRDRATFIAAMAIKLESKNEQDRYLLSRAGFGWDAMQQKCYVILMKLEDCHFSYDPHFWGNSRTMQAAHEYIIEFFDSLDSGSVIDIEFILGLTLIKKESESNDRLVDQNSE